MRATKGQKRVHSEKAIDAAARQARDRIMRRVDEVLLDANVIAPRERVELRRAIFHDIGDCVRLHSTFEPKKRNK